MKNSDFIVQLSIILIFIASISFFIVSLIRFYEKENEISIYEKALSSTYKLVSDDGGSATVFDIGNGYFVSAKHAVFPNNQYGMVDSNSNFFKLNSLKFDNSYIDLALFKGISGKYHLKLECKDPKIGEDVIALGNTEELRNIFTWGKIIDASRHINDQWKNITLTNISIYPGMSGGPVFNVNGEVIGITTGFNIKNPNVAFITPAKAICEELDKLHIKHN